MKGNYLIIGASGGIGSKLTKDLKKLSCNLLLGVHKTFNPDLDVDESLQVDGTSFDSVHSFIQEE
jgi:nucleoside-diphosphate-sugar epimerase